MVLLPQPGRRAGRRDAGHRGRATRPDRAGAGRRHRQARPRPGDGDRRASRRRAGTALHGPPAGDAGPRERHAHHRAGQHGRPHRPRPTARCGPSWRRLGWRPGGVSISLQSGPLGTGILELAARLGVGMASFVSLGDKADVSGNDLLQYWEDDPATKVVLVYTESFGNPRKFARIARRVSQRKPIVAVRAGGSLDPTTEALYEQAGVIRVRTVRELFDTARVLDGPPLPRGNRVMVVSNAVSPAILALDAARVEGLAAAELGVDVAEELLAPLPAGSTLEAGVLQLTYRAMPADYGHAVQALLAADEVDALVVIFAPPLPDLAALPAAALLELEATLSQAGRRGDGRPGRRAARGGLAHPRVRLPRARRRRPGPRRPARRATSLPPGRRAAPPRRPRRRGGARDRRARAGCPPRGHGPPAAARPRRCCAPTASPCRPAARSPPRRRPWTRPRSSATRWRSRPPASCAGAARSGPGWRSTSTTRPRSAGRGRASPRSWALPAMVEAVVQTMAPPGVELRVAVEPHHALGPVVTFGLGGVLADAIDDRVPRLVPFATGDAAAMIAASRAVPSHGGRRHRATPWLTCWSGWPAWPTTTPSWTRCSSTPPWRRARAPGWWT